MRYVNHQFFPTGTLTAVIRQYNGYDMSPDELQGLVDQYNALNAFAIPKPYAFAKIPLLDRVVPPNVEVHVHGE
jgi:hypothetical protein